MDLESAFSALRGTWLKMKQGAIDGKKDFQKDADICAQFFSGPYDHMYEGGSKHFLFQGQGAMPRPSICMTVNKVAEGVQLFGPTLYHANPVRKVSPRTLPKLPPELFGDPNDPRTQEAMMPVLLSLNQSVMQDKVRAALMQAMLNYLPQASDLKTESRRAIDQAIITGVGILWTQVHRPIGSNRKSVCSVYDSQKNWLMDPDQDRMDEAKVCYQRCCKPVWEVEAEYGHEPGTLRGNATSTEGHSITGTVGNDYLRKTGKTNDLMVYWKIWSKMGVGSLLKGINKDAAEADIFGRFVHLVVADNYPFLINVPKSIWNNQAEMARRVQWETPFWADDLTTNGWPCSQLIFHEVPDQLYPMSHFKPALGELQFINWGYSFLISKIERASRDFLAHAKGIEEELKQALIDGGDFTLLPIAHATGMKVSELVSFIQHPPFHGDIYKVISAVERNFEQRTGLSELMYGATQSSFRSAEEANVKQNQLQIRPDDMASKVEDWQSEVARKEALACRFHFDGAPDVAPVFGTYMGQLWDQFVASADIAEIVHQLDYRIEAGTMKKPNQMRDAENAQQAMQVLGPIVVPLAQATGEFGPINALIEEFGDAIGFDTSKVKLSSPPPPPAPPPEPDPREEQESELAQSEAEHKMDLRHKQESHKADMKIKKEKAKASSNGKGD